MHSSSSRSTTVAMTSSHSVELSVTSSCLPVKSAFFDVQKANTSTLMHVVDSRQTSPPPITDHAWRQHPGSSLTPAAFLDYIRLINLHHQLAVQRRSLGEIDGTGSRTDVNETPGSVGRPAVLRPTPLQPFTSPRALHQRHLDMVDSTSTASDPLPLWRPALKPSASRDPVPLLRCGSNISRGSCTASFLPPPVLFPPPPSLTMPPRTPSLPSSSSTSEFAPWLSRNCAGLLSAVMQRQIAAAVTAAAAAAEKSVMASGPPPTSDVLAPSRLPGPPSVRFPTPPSTGSKRLFSCPQCRYLTDRKNNLKRHVSTMHHESDKQLECCTIAFKSKASLRDHVLIFHGAGYQCRHCGRNFCRKALLKRHLTVHSGQKDYVCARCDYATSHKSNLERHKKVHERQSSAERDVEDHFSDDDVMTSDTCRQVPDFRRHAHCSQATTGSDVIDRLDETSCRRLASRDHREQEVELTDCSSCSSVDTRHAVSTHRADSVPHKLDTVTRDDDDDDDEIIDVV